MTSSSETLGQAAQGSNTVKSEVFLWSAQSQNTKALWQIPQTNQEAIS